MKKQMKAMLLVAVMSLSWSFQSALTEPNSSSSSASGSAEGHMPTVQLDTFTVNLVEVDRYLQTILTLQVPSDKVVNKIKDRMPIVKHHVILILSSKRAEDIKNTEGKLALTKEIKEKINQILKLKEDEAINDIFIENFVVQ